MERFEHLIGKKIFLRLATSRVYTGTVLTVGDLFITINDRFDKHVTIALSQIIELTEDVE